MTVAYVHYTIQELPTARCLKRAEAVVWGGDEVVD
jgi:hypothetical protein